MGLRNDKRKASTGTPKIENFYPGNWYTRHVGYATWEEKTVIQYFLLKLFEGTLQNSPLQNFEWPYVKRVMKKTVNGGFPIGDGLLSSKPSACNRTRQDVLDVQIGYLFDDVQWMLQLSCLNFLESNSRDHGKKHGNYLLRLQSRSIYHRWSRDKRDLADRRQRLPPRKANLLLLFD